MTLPHKKTLLDAGVHMGHLSKNWSPDFRPYLLMKRNKRHIINLDETLRCLEIAGEEIKKIIASGHKILFVARKKQASICREIAERFQQFHVTEKRWLGGAATNFRTIKKRLRYLMDTEKRHEDPSYMHLTKKEKLIVDRKAKKLEILLGGMASAKRVPDAFFIVDVVKEYTAVKEAHKLGKPIFAILDSNAPSKLITYRIPGNDDKQESITVIMNYIAEKMQEGLDIWEAEKQKRSQLRNPQEQPDKSHFSKPTTPISAAKQAKETQMLATQPSAQEQEKTDKTAFPIVKTLKKTVNVSEETSFVEQNEAKETSGNKDDVHTEEVTVTNSKQTKIEKTSSPKKVASSPSSTTKKEEQIPSKK